MPAVTGPDTPAGNAVTKAEPIPPFAAIAFEAIGPPIANAANGNITFGLLLSLIFLPNPLQMILPSCKFYGLRIKPFAARRNHCTGLPTPIKCVKKVL